jgi:hypothetical protein
MVINLPLLTEHASYNQNTQKYNSTKTLKPSNEKDSFHTYAFGDCCLCGGDPVHSSQQKHNDNNDFFERCNSIANTLS